MAQLIINQDSTLQTVENFEPQPGTQTHVLIDSWYLSNGSITWAPVRYGMLMKEYDNGRKITSNPPR